MSSTQSVERFLRAHLATAPRATPDGQAPRVRPFVTISRQAGAGGHTVAAALIEAFERQPDTNLFAGWQVFDQELVAMVASDPVFSKELDSLLEEEYRTTVDDFFHQVLRSSVDQDYVMARVFQVVRAVASVGKAVIVGRAGSEVTRGMGPGVRLRFVAPERDRIRRLEELFALDEKRARARARTIDTSRRRLLKTHFHVDIDDPIRYDAVWNTASASGREIGEATAAVLRTRAAVWELV